ncbi:ABC transporter permease [Candidatus Rariloculus sp.]|uniref:ABC transporter permease n=1 Tax=Candidatus Rariloculus sp. TaxID=3101265 RepID=UPI003D0AF877
MSRVTRLRVTVIAIAAGLVEILCRTGVVSPFTMIPPSEMVVGLGTLFAAGEMRDQIAQTLINVAAALASAVVVGFLVGAGLFAVPRARRVVDPLLASYYAIPIIVFYPFFIVVFGLNRYPQIAIGFLLAVVAMIINTLNGFDRVPQVLLKTARVMRLGRVATIRRVILPFATLYVFTGLKLAVAYAFIGVIAAEFILSGEGIGYEIAFAFNNFDNRVMYPLILLVLVISSAINMALYVWERRFLDRQTGNRGEA